MSLLKLRPSDCITLEVGSWREQYQALPHPRAPSFVHSMEGSEGEVFHIRARSGDEFALKVFRVRLRQPQNALRCEAIRPLASMPGLRCADRWCFTHANASSTLSAIPALNCAMLLPWISGPTWADVVRPRRAVAMDAALKIAASFCDVMCSLERAGISHGDLSGGNVIVDNRGGVQLVDLEHVFAPGIESPSCLALGTPGYNIVDSAIDLQCPEADRFAGAVLLMEMLSWGNDGVVSQSSADGSYFDGDDIRNVGSGRFLIMREWLRRLNPTLAECADRAWGAVRRRDAPRFAEWASALRGLTGRLPADAAEAHAPTVVAHGAALKAVAQTVLLSAPAPRLSKMLSGVEPLTAARQLRPLRSGLQFAPSLEQAALSPNWSSQPPDEHPTVKWNTLGAPATPPVCGVVWKSQKPTSNS